MTIILYYNNIYVVYVVVVHVYYIIIYIYTDRLTTRINCVGNLLIQFFIYYNTYTLHTYPHMHILCYYDDCVILPIRYIYCTFYYVQ